MSETVTIDDDGVLDISITHNGAAESVVLPDPGTATVVVITTVFDG